MDDAWLERKKVIAERFPLRSRPNRAVYSLPLPDSASTATRCFSAGFVELAALARNEFEAADPHDMSAMRAARDALLLSPHIEEVASGVYSFPVFDEGFAQEVVAELEHLTDILEKTGLKERPNSMNNYGVLLDEVGFTEGFSDVLLDHYLRPMAALLCQDHGGATLDHHRCFSVKYSQGKDTSLATHYDNAEVTLNVNVGLRGIPAGGSGGGDLLFHGENGKAQRSPPVRYKHRVGWGVLHPGRELHGATPLQRGERTNLIMWCRSASWRLKNGCGMCFETGGLKYDHMR